VKVTHDGGVIGRLSALDLDEAEKYQVRGKKKREKYLWNATDMSWGVGGAIPHWAIEAVFHCRDPPLSLSHLFAFTYSELSLLSIVSIVNLGKGDAECDLNDYYLMSCRHIHPQKHCQ
jgi:hypothetical protein